MRAKRRGPSLRSVGGGKKTETAMTTEMDAWSSVETATETDAFASSSVATVTDTDASSSAEIATEPYRASS